MKPAGQSQELPFFINPFWRKFVGKRLIVVSLSEPEHRIRDARALLALHSFLPPEESGLTIYRTVTIGSSEFPHLPDEVTDATTDGIVFLGRPALFGGEAVSFLQECVPPFHYSFLRNTCPDNLLETRQQYRTIEAWLGDRRETFRADLFDEQRSKAARPRELSDLALVYSGWQGQRPVAVFGGSSTVSTWGSVLWSMARPEESDLRWHQDVQGVLEARVNDTNRAFRKVTAQIHKFQLRVPTRIWMDGRDLPPASGWRGFLPGGTRKDLDIRILFNNRQVFQGRNHMAALVVLAWLNSSDRTEHANGIFRTRTSTPEALTWIDEFLGQKHAMGPRRTTQPHVNQILNEAANEVCRSGGLAAVDTFQNTADRFKHWFRDAFAFRQHASHQPGAVSHFTLWFREPPGFLPVFRLKSN